MEVVYKTQESLHVADYLVFAAVLCISLIIGLYHAFAGKQKTTEQYFMGDRQLHTVPVSLSILVSFISAILVLGLPAEMYTRGTQMIMRLLGYFLAIIVSTIVFVPLFYKLQLTSTFEYLDRRFESKIVRRMGSIMMLLGNIFYMGLLMYTPSTALDATTKIPTWISIVGMGIIGTIYTTAGGMKGVIYTDVFQAIVILAGLLIVVIVGTVEVGGIARVWRLSEEGGRLIFFNFNPDPSQRLSFWSLVIGGMFSNIIIFGIGQTSVQRYCALPTLRQAKICVYLNIPGLLIVNLLAAAAGLVVYAYYASIQCDPLKAKFISNSNQLVPYFIVDVLHYPTIPGLFLSVLFCGALSSLSSSLNSASAVTWEDFLKPCLVNLKDTHKTWISRILVFVYGILAILVSLQAQYIGEHVLQASLSFTGATSGPSLGMFMLGAFTTSANAVGVVIGCAVGLSLSLWLAIGSFVSPPYRTSQLATSIAQCALNRTAPGPGTDFTSVIPAWFTEGFDTTPISQMATDWVTRAPSKFELVGLQKFYGVSFLWYAFIGCMTTFICGYICSFIYNLFVPRLKDPDEALVMPIHTFFSCCLKPFLRRWYRRKEQTPNKVDLKSIDKLSLCMSEPADVQIKL